MIGKLLSLLTGGGASSRVCSVMIVDGERLLDGGDRSGPVERVQLLQKLGKFASREQLTVKVVLGGRPLREVDHQGEYAGVQVFYAENAKASDDQLATLARRFGRKSVVVTGSPALEAQLASGSASLMRATTLRRGLELASGDGGGGRSHGASGGGGGASRPPRNRRRRSGGRRNGSPDQGRRGENRDNRPAENSESGATGGSPSNADSAVKNLIDLVE